MCGNDKQTLVCLFVFPLKFGLFLLICESCVDFERKRNIERYDCCLGVAIVVIDFQLGPP